MRVLLWHVHGSWTTGFVQGRHDYLIPVTPDRDPDGLGRARTWSWPAAARELTPAQLRDAPVDIVVLQRPHELALAEQWLGGRRPGRDLPAVYVEHNAPTGPAATSRHPMADRDDLLIVHVTPFNRLFWDCGRSRSTVIEHGIVDPGERYTGELPRAAVVVNDPLRRGRVTGTDLLGRFAAAAPLDVFGMQVAELSAAWSGPPGRLRTWEDLPQPAMHAELVRRRVYLHPIRWTSLGLSLLEAMALGMPVVAIAATEVVGAVPPEAGVVSTDIDTLADAVRRFVRDPEEARRVGKAARAAALARYALPRFLADWDRLLTEVTA